MLYVKKYEMRRKKCETNSKDDIKTRSKWNIQSASYVYNKRVLTDWHWHKGTHFWKRRNKNFNYTLLMMLLLSSLTSKLIYNSSRTESLKTSGKSTFCHFQSKVYGSSNCLGSSKTQFAHSTQIFEQFGCKRYQNKH